MVTTVCSKGQSSIIFYAGEKFVVVLIFLNCWNTVAKHVVFMLHEINPCPVLSRP